MGFRKLFTRDKEYFYFGVEIFPQQMHEMSRVYCIVCVISFSFLLMSAVPFNKIVSAQSPSATLWAGTNEGTVLIYQLVVPPSSRRSEDVVQCILGWFTIKFCCIFF